MVLMKIENYIDFEAESSAHLSWSYNWRAISWLPHRALTEIA